jgi:hypothetical protein
MQIKINCEFNEYGAYCNCKEVKRKWYQITGRKCVEYPYRIIKCPYKKSTPKPKINNIK